MKKRIAALLLSILCLFMSFSLSACGKRGECEQCGQVESLKKFVHNKDVYWVCDDCCRMLKFIYS